MYKLWRNDGDNIEGQPSPCIFPSNLFPIIHDQIGSFVNISHKEGQNYIHEKKSIHNIVRNGKRWFWLLQESKFEGRNPGSINYQNNKESFPYPAKSNKFYLPNTSVTHLRWKTQKKRKIFLYTKFQFQLQSQQQNIFIRNFELSLDTYFRWNPMRTLPLHAQQPPYSSCFKSRETKSNFSVWLLPDGSSCLCLWKLKFNKVNQNRKHSFLFIDW